MTVIIDGTNGVQSVGGSASTASFTKDGDTNTGIFFPAADTIAFAEGGVEALRIDSSANVGIGTSSPSVKLHVSATDSTGVSAIRLQNTTATTGNSWQITSSNSGVLQLATIPGVADYLTMSSSGNLGIGTTTPTAKLNISGTSSAVGLGVTGTHSAGDTAINIAPASAITGAYNAIYSYPSASTGVGYVFGNSNTSSSSAHSRVDVLVGGANGGDPKITYTVSGVINWSIGVDNSDSDAFKISTSDAPGTSDRFIIGTSGVINSYATSGTGAQFSLYSNGQTTIPVTLAQGFATATDNIAYLFNRANAAFVFGTNNTERARILSTGELLVNATSQPGAYKLYTSGTDAFHAHTTETGGGGTPINVTRAGTSGTANLVLFASGGSGVGSISTNGTTTSYNTSSDRRLKENIVPADDAGDVIDAIEVVKHDWKNGGHTRYGVIAQDLNAVAPEAVAAGDDGDEIEKTWGVDYSKLVPMLVKEIQSLRARVAQLEAK